MKKIILMLYLVCCISFSNNFEKLNKFYLEAKEYNKEKLNVEINNLAKNLKSNDNTLFYGNEFLFDIMITELKVNKKSNEKMQEGINSNNINKFIESVNYDPKNILSFLNIISTYKNAYSLNELILLYKEMIKNDDLVDFIFIYFLNKNYLTQIYKNTKFADLSQKKSFIDLLYTKNTLPKSIQNIIYTYYILDNLKVDISNMTDLINFINDFDYLIYDFQLNILYNKFVEYDLILAKLATENKAYYTKSKEFDIFLSNFIIKNNLNLIDKSKI